MKIKKNEKTKNSSSLMKIGLPALIFAGMTLTINAATSIGWNYVGINPNPLADATVAGVAPYAQSHWNNHAGNGQGPGDTPLLNMIDSTGMTTTTSVTSWTLTANNSWNHNQTSDPLDGNIDLMDDFVNQNPSITFSDIPYDLYDIVVYYGNNEPANGNAISLLSVGSMSRNISTGDSAAAGYHSVGFIEETGDLSGKSNYTVFTGLSSKDITVAMSYVSGNPNNGISAIQIVAIPEPSSTLLLGLGALAFLRRRR